MKKYLVVYSTKRGQTKAIAEKMKELMEQAEKTQVSCLEIENHKMKN